MRRRLILLIAIVPAIILGLLVWRYSVNIPFLDQWDTPAKLLIEQTQGKLSWQQWMEQHTESRPLFPKLLFITLANITNWNNRYEMLVTFLLACLVSCNIYYLSKITFNNHWQHLSCFLLANLLIFNPIQQENWMWGFQSITFASIVAITTSFTIIFSAIPWGIKLIASLILSLIATFSFANGILCWIIILPALIFKLSQDGVSKTWIIFPWLSIFSLSITIYFYDYHSHSGASKFSDILIYPLLASRYFLSLLGSPIFPHDLLGSQIIGGIILISFAYGVFCLWNQRQNYQLIEKVLPWLLIGIYALLSAALITAGRINFGIDSSLTQRYITFSTYLVIAYIYLLTIFLQPIKDQRWKRIMVSILLIFFLITYKDNFITGVKWITKVHYQRTYGKTCILTFNLIQDEQCIIERIYPDPNHWLARAQKINDLGLLQPEILENIDWQNYQSETEANNASKLAEFGEFKQLIPSENGTYLASGWVSALPKKPSFDAVILASKTSHQPIQILAIAELNVSDDDLLELLIQPQKVKLMWNKSLAPQQIPLSENAITAWAFDSDDGKAYPLQKIHKMSN